MVYLILILTGYLLPVPYVWRIAARAYVNDQVIRQRKELPTLWRIPAEREALIRSTRSEAVLPALIISIFWPIAVPTRLFYRAIVLSDVLISDIERREAAEAEVIRLRQELAEARRTAADAGLPFPEVDR